MCECCNKKQLNSHFLNGNRNLFQCHIYKGYGEMIKKIDLCRLHAIELFRVGEVRFVADYGRFEEKAKPAKGFYSSSNLKNIELVIE